MHAAVIVFPGSNCDRDMKVAFENAGAKVSMVWHKDTEMPAGVDVIGVPGGFSFGDYLRCGAIAANSHNLRQSIKTHAEQGRLHPWCMCNGFQVLTETGLLPGAYCCATAGLKYICKSGWSAGGDLGIDLPTRRAITRGTTIGDSDRASRRQLLCR